MPATGGANACIAADPDYGNMPGAGVKAAVPEVAAADDEDGIAAAAVGG